MPQSRKIKTSIAFLLVAFAVVMMAVWSPMVSRTGSARGEATTSQGGAKRIMPAARTLTREQMAIINSTDHSIFRRPLSPNVVGEPDGRYEGILPKPEVTDHSQGATSNLGPAAFSYTGRLAANFIGHDMNFTPADPMIAAGPTHLVAVVNSQIAYFSKSGTNVFETGLFQFMELSGGDFGVFDPKVVFDEDSQRFFVSVLANNRNTTADISYAHFAVSKTSDPNDDWWIYNRIRNDRDSNWADYPGLGVSDRALYFTSLMVPFPGAPVAHRNIVWIFDKDAMIAGLSTTFWEWVDLPGESGKPAQKLIQPAVTYLPTSGPESYMVSVTDGADASEVRIVVQEVRLAIDFPLGGAVFDVVAIDGPGRDLTLTEAPQLGGPALLRLNNVGSPAMNAVYRDGRIWTVHHPGIGGATVMRHYELDVSSWPTLTLVSTVDFTDGFSTYFWPAIAVNQFGDVVEVCSRSSTTEFCGIRWTIKMAEESQFVGSRYLKAGESYYGSWGDYGGAAIDPVGQGFWLFHMYALSQDPQVFSTWIGHVPRPVFVDIANAGTEAGTKSRPWDTVIEGHAAALPDNDLVIRVGNYPGAVILNKPITIITEGGVVTIGQ